MPSGSSISLHSILRQYWGYSSFRPMQEDIIQNVLNGKDTLAIMPTGGGKSLCYQVPAMAQPGLCLVISPLIALMKDQTENLRKKGITALAIYSGMSRKEVEKTLITATESNCKFLYVSPERLETALFQEYLPGININLIAVDEAHCISQWGYDFRPPYLRITQIREELKNIPVLALTASATKEVQEDICNKLTLPTLQKKEEWKIFRQSFERPNLSYSVFNTAGKPNKMIEILSKVSGSSIIYCRTRNRTKEVADFLKVNGFAASYYHAGLTQEERNQRQEAWIKNETRIMVCTNAFGMGIDKPDVRTVIHADVPDCLENYYQEAGRAGRDGKKSYAVLLYNEKDISDLESQAAIRFPEVTEIKKVYQAIANYLQLPIYSGKDEYYDFDLLDFAKKFGLSTPTSLYSLKILEQDGWLSFNEQVYMPATAGFICTKEYLYQFQQHHPPLDNLIKSLLRAYEGIFDREVTISENQIAGLTKMPIEETKQNLFLLAQSGIITYHPQKDKPQIFFLKDRIKTEDLAIDISALQKRKENYLNKVKKILLYVSEKQQCRSQHIAAYFGDSHVPECGICDNCINKKTATLTKEEFNSIYEKIKSSIEQKPKNIGEVLLQFSGLQKEKARQVIAFYQSENKIEVDKNGMVKLL